MNGLFSVILALVGILVVNASHFPSTSRLSTRQTNITDPTLCTDPPRDSCDFYSVCLEAQYHCGPDGYPLKDGVYFCEKFSADRALLSAQGQTWMLDTMQCLQRALVPEAISTVGVTCDSLEQIAFASHAGCYIDSGLCTLPPSDWVAIVEIVGLQTLFESEDAFLATLQTGVGCLEAYIFFAANPL